MNSSHVLRLPPLPGPCVRVVVNGCGVRYIPRSAFAGGLRQELGPVDVVLVETQPTVPMPLCNRTATLCNGST